MSSDEFVNNMIKGKSIEQLLGHIILCLGVLIGITLVSFLWKRK